MDKKESEEVKNPYSATSCSKVTLPKQLLRLLHFWHPPPGNILDYTCGLGHTTSLIRETLMNNTLDHTEPYKVINLDKDKDSIRDIQCDNMHPPIRNNTMDLVYYDPPYSAGGRKYRTRNTKSLLTHSIETIYHRGVETLQQQLKEANETINQILKPKGTFILKLQNRYQYKNNPRVLPPFYVLDFFKNFYLHDYTIYTYYPSAMFNHNKKHQITQLGHGFFFCFKKEV